jgi:hypothetical protein
VTEGEEDVHLVAPGEGNVRAEVKSHRCPECGFPTRELGTLCSACLKRRFLREVLAFQREFFKQNPDYLIEVGRGGGYAHLGLVGHRDLGWCGDKITEPRSKRKRMEMGRGLPAGICGICLKAYDEILGDRGGV